VHRDYASVVNMMWKTTPEAWTKAFWWDMKRLSKNMNWREYEGESNPLVPNEIVKYMHAILKEFKASEQSPAVLARAKPMNPARQADEGRARKPSHLEGRGGGQLSIDALRDVFMKHGVKYAFLFGSRARVGTGRDYDIAVVFERRLDNAIELGSLIVDLAEALGVHEDLIDLVDLESAPLSLVKTVIDEGRVLWGGDEALDYLWRRYLMYLDANDMEELTSSP